MIDLAAASMSTTVWQQHVAGMFMGGIQRCVRCGLILTDHRSDVCPHEGKLVRLPLYETGAHVWTTGQNPALVIAYNPAPESWRPCDIWAESQA